MAEGKILIATGIYPPAIGGPSEYAKNLFDTWNARGYHVEVKHFSFENKLPTVIRHVYFFLRSLPAIWRADNILVLDTWSVALPVAFGCMILGKKFIIRTGGDFLWESYVERTKKQVLFRNFYTDVRDLSVKEKCIFKMTKWVLQRASKIIFSTTWQRDIWALPYGIENTKTEIIENFYGEHDTREALRSKVFMGATRKLVWKNIPMLQKVFEDKDLTQSGYVLDLKTGPHAEFLDRMRASFAVILVSLGDISPNMIMDAIRTNTPFIVTREVGIYERIKDIGVFVDPLNEDDIKQKILWLTDNLNYEAIKKRVTDFNFRHSWTEISNEIMNVFENI